MLLSHSGTIKQVCTSTMYLILLLQKHTVATCNVTLLYRATYKMAVTSWLRCDSHWCLLHTALQGDKTTSTAIPTESYSLRGRTEHTSSSKQCNRSFSVVLEVD